MTNEITRGTGAGISGVDSTSFRNSGVLHRNAITAVDKLSVPGTVTSTDGGVGGTLANVAYYTAVAAGNRWGTTGPGTLPGTITPTASHFVNIAFAQVTGADYYDIFLSTDVSAPKWVCRITEAQRAAGSIQVTVVGTVAVGASAAGSVNIGVVGTGLACTVAPFLANNAYTPATPTSISCVGFSKAHVLVKLTASFATLPTLSIIPFFSNQTSPTDFHQGSVQGLSIGSGTGQSLEQDLVITLDGATGLVVLIDALTGSGTPAVSVWVELV